MRQASFAKPRHPRALRNAIPRAGTVNTSSSSYCTCDEVHAAHATTSNAAVSVPFMPCRPKLCQRLAAQLTHTPSSATTSPANGSHIWISDDLLSEAFDRYVRVSHASRRYGSNVPGPLEHRRRLAKRKMGCAAVTAGAPMPPGGDFGAIFGAGRYEGTGWKWEAPGLKLGEPPPRAMEEMKVPEWNSPVELRPEPKMFSKPAPASEDAFRELLEERADLETLDTGDLLPVLTFLRGWANESSEQTNRRQFFSWLAEDRAATAPAFDALLEFFCEEVQSRVVERGDFRRLSHALRSLTQQSSNCDNDAQRRFHATYLQIWHAYNNSPHKKPSRLMRNTFRLLEASGHPQDLQRGIECFAGLLPDPANLLHSGIAKCLGSILKALRYLPVPEDESKRMLDQLTIAMDWIREDSDRQRIFLLCVDDQNNFGAFLPAATREEAVRRLLLILGLCNGSKPGHVEAHEVYAAVAKYLKPIDLAEHFNAMKSKDFCRILLQSWLPHADLDAFVQGTPDEIEAPMDAGDQKRLTFNRLELSHENLPVVLAHYEKFLKEADEHANAGKPHLIEFPHVHFLRALSAAGIRYDRICQVLFTTLQAMLVPGRLHNVFSRCFYNKELALPTPVAISLVKHFINISMPFRALNVFRTVPSVCITDVPKLSFALLELDITSERYIFEFLNRQPHMIAIPDRIIESLNLQPGHIDLAHVLAHKLAQHQGINARIAWRRVWTIYRWLRSRCAPPQPLLTRSLVHAGIIRFLQERRYVPLARVHFIVSLIDKVEGPEMAVQVEKLANALRMQSYPQVQRRIHLRLRALRKANREGRWAKHAAYRMRTWALARPRKVILEDGSVDYIVPEEERKKKAANMVAWKPEEESQRPVKVTKYLIRPALETEADTQPEAQPMALRVQQRHFKKEDAGEHEVHVMRADLAKSYIGLDGAVGTRSDSAAWDELEEVVEEKLQAMQRIESQNRTSRQKGRFVRGRWRWGRD